ncbi:MAG TPA: DUF1569 domain-containing protein, partial [Cyclobacteriaceae bacterium]|nr:DUF1569 domain-containing protein [Cyclobacteriaceae bacterium]
TPSSMKTIFEPSALLELEKRIASLTPQSQRQWGKMEVDQMVAHCAETMLVVLDRKKIPRSFLGYVLGPFFKSSYYNDSPVSKNSPTAKEFVITQRTDLDAEKTRLLDLVREFSKGGEANCTKEPHAFFGKLTPEQWGKAMYKHLDHHLKQFGA